ncbi:U6 snRNA phosphodiesterase [Sergentomyia squamirostris]
MLVDYSSSEDDDKEEVDYKKSLPNNRQVPKLPSALELLGGRISASEDCEDTPDDHEGRIRSFAHERGIWATFCYIPFLENSSLISLQVRIKDSIRKALNLELTEARDFHVSLTRTVVLRHHWIESFVASLEAKFQHTRKFSIHLNSLRIYCNEENTRTFVGLTLSEEVFPQLKNLVESCNEVVREFNLKEFYREMSFHISILWIVGNHLEVLRSIENELQEIFLQYLGENFDDFVTVVEKIHCKSGNKMHNFHLL